MGNNYAPLLKKNTNKLAILFGLVIETHFWYLIE
jgi:hypothetical protein